MPLSCTCYVYKSHVCLRGGCFFEVLLGYPLKHALSAVEWVATPPQCETVTSLHSVSHYFDKKSPVGLDVWAS